MTESTNTVHVGTQPASGVAVEARFVKVEGEITSLKSDIGDIKTGVKEIGAQIASRSQPNWHALALAAAFIVPFLGWSWSQLSNISDHLEKATANFVSRADIQDKFNSAKEVADLKAQIASGKIDRVAAAVADLQTKIVPLEAHKELWARQRDENDNLRRFTEENRRILFDLLGKIGDERARK